MTIRKIVSCIFFILRLVLVLRYLSWIYLLFWLKGSRESMSPILLLINTCPHPYPVPWSSALFAVLTRHQKTSLKKKKESAVWNIEAHYDKNKYRDKYNTNLDRYQKMWTHYKTFSTLSQVLVGALDWVEEELDCKLSIIAVLHFVINWFVKFIWPFLAMLTSGASRVSVDVEALASVLFFSH